MQNATNMPRGRKKKNVEEGSLDNEGIADEEAEDIEVKGGAHAVEIHDSRKLGYSYVRTYSKARHGKDYEDLADEFVKGHEPWAVKTGAQDRGENEK